VFVTWNCRDHRADCGAGHWEAGQNATRRVQEVKGHGWKAAHDSTNVPFVGGAASSMGAGGSSAGNFGPR